MVSGTASYDDQGRAKVEARAKGMAKLYAKEKCGSFTGAALIIPGGDHIAHQLVIALEQEMTVSQMKSLPRYHPTLEEGLSDALG
ncbi:MAG: dihydrolipoyl dehydrogenase, partial [Erythrobacter sp.]|nr:dihydrolipoyl dehydrogenase [Erythrobacter sp.]